MQYIAFILNIPWTIVGLVVTVVSIPTKASFHRDPLAIIFNVKSFWWYKWLPSRQGARAMANGHTIQLGPLVQKGDLEHELMHVQQAIREPLIHPLLYLLQNIRYGYRNNKYEKEAYNLAKNEYRQ